MNLGVIQSAAPHLLTGALMTIGVSLAGIAIGQVLGAVICVGRLSGRAGNILGGLYVSFFRGVPALVLLLLIYYLLPLIGINVPPLVASVTALGLSSAAYVSEIYRGALNAVPVGHTEAARSLGMTEAAIRRRILLPQVLKLSVPALINELILLLKASSLISVVGVAELTRVSQTISASTYRPLELYTAAGVIYLVINGVFAMLGAAFERRLRQGAP